MTTAATAASQLSIRRIATYQKYSAHLVFLSETAQQTALPLQEALVRESIQRGLSVIVVCIEGQLSADIMDSPQANVVDCRPTLDQIGSGAARNSAIDFAHLSRVIRQTQAIGTKSAAECTTTKSSTLVVFDSIDLLLHTSILDTLSLLRSIRSNMAKTLQSRILARFSRDILTSKAEGASSSQNIGLPLVSNTLNCLADAVIDVYPLDTLPTWMPGWYSNGTTRPFVSLKDNDSRRGILRLEHRKHSGKIGLELSSFEISDNMLPEFRAIDIPSAAASLYKLPGQTQPQNKQQASSPPQKATAQAVATSPQGQQQLDPAAGLPFNLNLTDKQRRDRANVELPYMEVQFANASISGNSDQTVSGHSSVGGGDGSGGGKIHYQLDETDDWDDEDDLDDDLEI
ncbi:hypothetical protein GGI25_000470 [Coemansia spiralis]|uniref:Elongator complex protein 5 n=2 Tax=Coemansia TaxID=4863 RepID=A0A9W8L1G0_9FUNG|nr:hypothetical protein EDC05_000298 [Coemansia umbellata]KAJ2624129.1 hypothetical protein GGI26_001704 [Coemansia sp. RSA 1358]KAJ2680834.1 hypothetical protein GGI25_000470 [Coemansia spiralis]